MTDNKNEFKEKSLDSYKVIKKFFNKYYSLI
jgi:hypothetical protein